MFQTHSLPKWNSSFTDFYFISYKTSTSYVNVKDITFAGNTIIFVIHLVDYFVIVIIVVIVVKCNIVKVIAGKLVKEKEMLGLGLDSS